MSSNSDRWAEIDLYWFDRQNIGSSVDVFWRRMAPMYVNVVGWRGLIINAGWLVDHILDWRGDLDASIPFPAGLLKDKQFATVGMLRGSLEERRAEWSRRFANQSREEQAYEPWTYRDLARLVAELRRVAAEVHEIHNLRVGSFVLGWSSVYSSVASAWSRRHPEAFFDGPWVDRLFNVCAELDADPTSYGGFPDGIAAGTKISRYFGGQWGSVASKVGLDTILLRDSMIGQGIYERFGPFGTSAPDNPALVHEWTAATAALVRETKQAAPDALVMGYSNAASAVGDWRVNCVDLEAIANEGYLDAWIDQTWAGAWNEVGQREEVFWNEPLLGWTQQLANVLVHGAILQGSRVRHYTVVETFDAWESWDVIHGARERLRWAIWAYLHAFVKTTEGLASPDGAYVSWLNQGNELLSEQDVAFLVGAIDDALLDAHQTREVHGATLVYCRSAMSWLTNNQPQRDVKEWIDEYASLLLKYGTPILSATRVEQLSPTTSDYLVVQSPTHLKQRERDQLLELMTNAQPVLIVGSPQGGSDQEIAEAAGMVSAEQNPQAPAIHYAYTLEGDDAGLPQRGPILQRLTRNRATESARVVYRVDGSPVLVENGEASFWDPPEVQHRSVDEFSKQLWSTRADRSMAEAMVSVEPVVVTARLINDRLAASHRIFVSDLDADSPLTVSVWTLVDGVTMVLAADLEEGFRAHTEGTRRATVHIPDKACTFVVALQHGQSQLFRVDLDGARPLWDHVS